MPISIIDHFYIDKNNPEIRRDIISPDYIYKNSIINRLVIENNGVISFNEYNTDNIDYLLYIKTLDNKHGLGIFSPEIAQITLKSELNSYETKIYQEENSLLKIDSNNVNKVDITNDLVEFNINAQIPQLTVSDLIIGNDNIFDIFKTIDDTNAGLNDLRTELMDYTNNSVLNLKNEFINLFYTKPEINNTIDDLREYLENYTENRFNDLLNYTYDKLTIDNKLETTRIDTINDILNYTYSKAEINNLDDNVKNELKIYSDTKNLELKQEFIDKFLPFTGGELTGNLFLTNDSLLNFGEILENGTTFKLYRINQSYENNTLELNIQNATTNMNSISNFRITNPETILFKIDYQGDAYIKNNLQLDGSLIVNGNFTVQGNSYTISSNELNIVDNIITLNEGEQGDGVTLNYSGIEIDRGNLQNIQWVFDESDDSFKHWINGNLGPIKVPLSPGHSNDAVSKYWVDNHDWLHSDITDWDQAIADTLKFMTDPVNVEKGISVSVDTIAKKLNFDIRDFTLTFAGDVSGSVNIVDLNDVTANITVLNDSHTHDSRYYTEAESDNRFVNVDGDILTGDYDITDAILKWSKDSDYASLYFGDYGSDLKWLTFQFADNTGVDRIRFNFEDINHDVYTVMDVLSNGTHFYRSNIYLYNNEDNNPSIHFQYSDNLSWKDLRWNNTTNCFEIQLNDGTYHRILTDADTGSNNNLDADTVDGFHASTTPTYNYLIPLDINKKFPNSLLYTGHGQGLDADLLDNKEGSFYQDASNLNSGTIPVDRLNGVYNIDISGSANLLGGLDPSQFLRSDDNDYYTGTLSFNVSGGTALAFDSDSNINFSKKITINDGSGNFVFKSNFRGDYKYEVDGSAAQISLMTENTTVGQIWLEVAKSGNAGDDLIDRKKLYIDANGLFTWNGATVLTTDNSNQSQKYTVSSVTISGNGGYVEYLSSTIFPGLNINLTTANIQVRVKDTNSSSPTYGTWINSESVATLSVYTDGTKFRVYNNYSSSLEFNIVVLV